MTPSCFWYFLLLTSKLPFLTSTVTSARSQSGVQHSPLINPDKTKLLIVGLPQLTRGLSLPPIVLMGKNIKPAAVVKDLAVWVDTAVTFDDHISKLSSSCLYKLRRINRIKHLLDSKILIIIINALIFSRLFYCSNV